MVTVSEVELPPKLDKQYVICFNHKANQYTVNLTMQSIIPNYFTLDHEVLMSVNYDRLADRIFELAEVRPSIKLWTKVRDELWATVPPKFKM